MKGCAEQERDTPRRHSEAWHNCGLQDRLRSSSQLKNLCIKWQTFFQSGQVVQVVLLADILVSLLWGCMQLSCVTKNKERSLSDGLSLPCSATGFRLSVFSS